MASRGFNDDDSSVESFLALVDPAQRAQLKADCSDTSVEYGIDSVTVNRVVQALNEIYAGKDLTASFSPSSVSPANTSPS